MRYIVQIFTGGWDSPLYTAEAIVERLRTVTERLPVDKVILGWHPDAALYRKVGAFLRERGIAMFLWLPVFSEIGDLVPTEAACDLWGRSIDVTVEQAGETFSFGCPTSAANADAVTAVYGRYFAELPFDGVFLDRVRTQSFLGGVGGGLSCGCARCREAYRLQGVSLDSVQEAYERLGDRFFDRDGGRLSREEARRFFEAKGRVVSEAVASLCRRFRARGLQVGLDVFAPSLAPFVGQDLSRLAKDADFLKPMLYRRTDAPAGVVYEYDRLRAAAPTALGYPPLTADAAWLRAELDTLSALPSAVYAGVEINRREDIAPTDADYVRESAALLRQSGVQGMTLSWDVMLAPDEHLEALRETV